jgi:hypothetical protein
MIVAASRILATAQEAPIRPAVCLAIDEAHDTFSPEDRQAALILVAREFEQADRSVSAQNGTPCRTSGSGTRSPSSSPGHRDSAKGAPRAWTTCPACTTSSYARL